MATWLKGATDMNSRFLRLIIWVIPIGSTQGILSIWLQNWAAALITWSIYFLLPFVIAGREYKTSDNIGHLCIGLFFVGCGWCWGFFVHHQI